MRILDCPECDWTTKPKHKRPKSALGLHRKAKHGQYDAVVTPDGTGTHTSLQAAVDAVQEGGRVLVQPGTYHEQIEVSENTDIRARPGFLITLLDGTQHFVPAEDHQETIDRHWFFRGGALKESFKRNTVAAVEVA